MSLGLPIICVAYAVYNTWSFIFSYLDCEALNQTILFICCIVLSAFEKNCISGTIPNKCCIISTTDHNTLGNSSRNIMNSIGLNSVPYGTRYSTGLFLLTVPPIFTFSVLFNKYDFICWFGSPLIPFLYNILSRMLCGTMSIAIVRSRQIAIHFFPFFKIGYDVVHCSVKSILCSQVGLENILVFR